MYALAATLALLLTAAPPPPMASACPAMPRPGKVPWKTGERLTYDIDVLGANAGELALVAEPPQGRGTSLEYPLHALARSNSFFSKIRKVHGRSTSFVGAKDLHPRRYHEETREDDVEKWTDVAFGGEHVATIDWKRNKVSGSQHLRFGSDGFDPVSAAYYMRALEFTEGQPICFDVYGIRKIWRIHATAIGIETVRVPAGIYRAWHLQGEAVRTDSPDSRREIHLWISADDRRLPVASLGVLDLGAVRAQLTHDGSASEEEGGGKAGRSSILDDR